MWGPGPGSGSEDQSLGSRTFVVFVPAGPAHPLSQKGGEGGGLRGCLAGIWTRSLGLLISSGFQAPGGSAGHPFQGAVAPAPGRGLQEMACGAGRTEVLWGLAWSWRSCKRRGHPPHPVPLAPREPGLQGQPLQGSAAGEIFLRLEGPAGTGGPEGARPAGRGPSGDFSCGQPKGQVGRRWRWRVQRVQTLRGS